MKTRQRTWTKRVTAILSLAAVTLPLATNVAQHDRAIGAATGRIWLLYGYI